MKLKFAKKLTAVLMAGLMVVLAGCSGGTNDTTAAAGSEAAGSESAGGEAAASDYKIAIMYTDASQSEEPVRAFEDL